MADCQRDLRSQRDTGSGRDDAPNMPEDGSRPFQAACDRQGGMMSTPESPNRRILREVWRVLTRTGGRGVPWHLWRPQTSFLFERRAGGPMGTRPANRRIWPAPHLPAACGASWCKQAEACPALAPQPPPASLSCATAPTPFWVSLSARGVVVRTAGGEGGVDAPLPGSFSTFFSPWCPLWRLEQLWGFLSRRRR